MRHVSEQLAKVELTRNNLIEKQQSLSNSIETYIVSNLNNFEEFLSECDNTAIQDRSHLLEKFKMKLINVFEPNWIHWDHNSIFYWFKYILINNTHENINENKKDENDSKESENHSQFELQNLNVLSIMKSMSKTIDWNKIQSNLTKKEMTGKWLMIIDEQELKKLGFNQEIDRNILMNKIKKLATTHKHKINNWT